MGSGLLEFQKMVLKMHGSDNEPNVEEIDNEKEIGNEKEIDLEDHENLADQEPSFAYDDVEINDDNIYDAYNSVVNDLNIMIAKYEAVVNRRSDNLKDYDSFLNKYEKLLNKYEELLEENESLNSMNEMLIDKVHELEDELDY